MALELMLFSVSTMFLLVTWSRGGVFGTAVPLLLLAVAATESVIGLGLAILMHRLKNSTNLINWRLLHSIMVVVLPNGEHATVKSADSFLWIKGWIYKLKSVEGEYAHYGYILPDVGNSILLKHVLVLILIFVLASLFCRVKDYFTILITLTVKYEDLFFYTHHFFKEVLDLISKVKSVSCSDVYATTDHLTKKTSGLSAPLLTEEERVEYFIHTNLPRFLQSIVPTACTFLTRRLLLAELFVRLVIGRIGLFNWLRRLYIKIKLLLISKNFLSTSPLYVRSFNAIPWAVKTEVDFVSGLPLSLEPVVRSIVMSNTPTKLEEVLLKSSDSFFLEQSRFLKIGGKKNTSGLGGLSLLADMQSLRGNHPFLYELLRGVISKKTTTPLSLKLVGVLLNNRTKFRLVCKLLTHHHEHNKKRLSAVVVYHADFSDFYVNLSRNCKRGVFLYRHEILNQDPKAKFKKIRNFISRFKITLGVFIFDNIRDFFKFTEFWVLICKDLFSLSDINTFKFLLVELVELAVELQRLTGKRYSKEYREILFAERNRYLKKLLKGRRWYRLAWRKESEAYYDKFLEDRNRATTKYVKNIFNRLRKEEGELITLLNKYGVGRLYLRLYALTNPPGSSLLYGLPKHMPTIDFDRWYLYTETTKELITRDYIRLRTSLPRYAVVLLGRLQQLEPCKGVFFSLLKGLLVAPVLRTQHASMDLGLGGSNFFLNTPVPSGSWSFSGFLAYDLFFSQILESHINPLCFLKSPKDLGLNVKEICENINRRNPNLKSKFKNSVGAFTRGSSLRAFFFRTMGKVASSYSVSSKVSLLTHKRAQNRTPRVLQVNVMPAAVFGLFYNQLYSLTGGFSFLSRKLNYPLATSMVLSTAAPELVLIGEEDEDLALEAQFARIRNFPLLAELGENNFFRDIQVDRNGYFYPWLGGSSDVTRPSLEEELAKVRDIAFRQLPPELESSYINEMVPQLRAVPADAVELNQVLVKNSIGRSRLIYLFLRLQIQRFESALNLCFRNPLGQGWYSRNSRRKNLILPQIRLPRGASAAAVSTNPSLEVLSSLLLRVNANEEVRLALELFLSSLKKYKQNKKENLQQYELLRGFRLILRILNLTPNQLITLLAAGPHSPLIRQRREALIKTIRYLIKPKS